MKTREELVDVAKDWFNAVPEDSKLSGHLDNLIDDGAKPSDLYVVLACFADQQIEAYKAEVMDAIETGKGQKGHSTEQFCRFRIHDLFTTFSDGTLLNSPDIPWDRCRAAIVEAFEAGHNAALSAVKEAITKQ